MAYARFLPGHVLSRSSWYALVAGQSHIVISYFFLLCFRNRSRLAFLRDSERYLVAGNAQFPIRTGRAHCLCDKMSFLTDKMSENSVRRTKVLVSGYAWDKLLSLDDYYLCACEEHFLLRFTNNANNTNSALACYSFSNFLTFFMRNVTIKSNSTPSIVIR